MRICITCNKAKDLNEFYFRKYKGKLYPYSDCKDCHKTREVERRKLPEVRQKLVKASVDYYYENKHDPYFKLKTYARNALRDAVKRGRIIKHPCRDCGELKVEAHHYLGYEKEHRLDVQWLCRKHHEIQELIKVEN